MPVCPRDQTRPSITIRAGGPLFLGPLLLILGLLTYQCWTGYQAARREAQTTVINLADMLTLTIKSSLDRISTDLDVFASIIAKEHDFPLSIAAARNAEIEEHMRISLQGFEAVLNYRIFDAAGQSVLGIGRVDPRVKINVADRDWFQKLQNAPTRTFVLSEVLISKASGRLGVVFAHPIRDDAGRFLGSVNAYIDLDWFQTIIDALNIGDEGLVTLRHRELSRLLLRRPKVEAQLNESLTGLYQLHTSNLTRVEGEFESAIDHLRRLYAFRGMGSYPLTVVVAVSANDYLKPWYIQATVTAAIALLLSAIQIVIYRRLTQAYRQSLAQADELQAINVNLQRSNAELEEFAYIASHDLQSPLRNIASFSQLLHRRFKDQLGTEGAEFIDFIVSNTMRMSGLIQDLLTYARVSRQCAPPPPVSVNDVVNVVLTDLAQPISEAGANIDIASLPVIPINEHQLSSLFMNLLDNALKYRHPDRTPEITIAAEPTQNNMWLFSIADNGIGIAPEYWERIFSIFQRLHTVDRYEGTGIGLALCRRIVHRWGGTIWVTSVPDTGSTFFFTVPAQ
ncbi:sensor histidine kinase [Magnetospirillum sulfuroxidans]|uniref:histidine kinase n=1 Tax=Magnetospirillum sulfuroxidans TaxID=611300 RepID=A0ABS5IAG8_9PROT|nr:sensor histidine kinase [Magnetospirillum sulfuroxidans]MBR9971385.1 GHKL domain-containing protein [Magnetospirillum sulfuroxidans]